MDRQPTAHGCRAGLPTNSIELESDASYNQRFCTLVLSSKLNVSAVANYLALYVDIFRLMQLEKSVSCREYRRHIRNYDCDPVIFLWMKRKSTKQICAGQSAAMQYKEKAYGGKKEKNIP